jgi:uncharacterized lipoprotein YddW (UPF0748 family)
MQMSNLSRPRPVGAVLAMIALTLAGCTTSPKPASEPPAFPREFRAAWVTTWENVDWPSSGKLSTAQQQKEIDAIIERAKDLKLNALLLQVRGTANAIHPSKHEPWAGSLTGKRGRAPDPMYDPLKMWIQKSHAAGIELHAWVIPFVAWNEPLDQYKGPHRPTVLAHASNKYFDPGDDATQKYLLMVMDEFMDYDIDGYAFEHHFYPPPSTQPSDEEENTERNQGAVRDFPDQESFKRYRNKGGQLSLQAWRRDNITRFFKTFRAQMTARKPWLRLGISPFGIPSPNTPAFVKGAPYLDQYRVTYADPELWLRSGLCDYLIPELYWKTGAANQPFPALLKAWVDPSKNPRGRNVYAGLFTSHVNKYSTSWSPDEIAGQIMIARHTPGASGHAHFSMRAMTENRKGIADLLRQGVYSDGALPPRSPWLGEKHPAAPTKLTVSRLTPGEVQSQTPRRVIAPPFAQRATTGPATRPFVALARPSEAAAARAKTLGGVKLAWERPKAEGVWRWAVYSKHGDHWHFQVVGRENATGDSPISAIVRDHPAQGPAKLVFVSAIDRVGNESAKVKLDVTLP